RTLVDDLLELYGPSVERVDELAVALCDLLDEAVIVPVPFPVDDRLLPNRPTDCETSIPFGRARQAQPLTDCCRVGCATEHQAIRSCGLRHPTDGLAAFDRGHALDLPDLGADAGGVDLLHGRRDQLREILGLVAGLIACG